jgi:ubiquinone/menaquinone biosynthesis C-methylase UbiE
MSLRKTIVAQFGNPHGFLGRIAGWIMAKRPSNRERNHWTVDSLNIQSGDRIIEIGCGPGLALEDCLVRVGDGHVVGLDHSQTMLDQARTRNAEAAREGRLDLRLGNLEDLAVADSSFDKVCSVNVVQFFPDRAAAFRKIYSLLKPKGVAATTYMPRGKNPDRENALNMAEEVKRHMEVAGFTNIRIEELPMEPTPAVCIIGERP